MNKELKELQNLKDRELEEYGAKIFQNIGLTCCHDLGQVRLSDIVTGYQDNEHLEFDYIIPYNNVCLIGEITAREDKKDIKKKYEKFIKQINIIKNLNFSADLWSKLGIKLEHIKLFREVEEIKAFCITTKQEKYNLTLNSVSDVVVLHKADFLRIIEYSKTIGKWAKNYFLHNFNIKHNSNCQIYDLCDKDILIDKGVITIERYFNEVFSVFYQDKIDSNKISKSSFQYSKFWAGLINLLYTFIEEGFSWNEIKKEFEAIKSNLMKLQEIEEYNQPLFSSQNPHIPDAKYSPTKICKFFNENRSKAYSIQNIK